MNLEDFTLARARKAYIAAGTAGASVGAALQTTGADGWVVVAGAVGAGLVSFFATWFFPNR